MILGLAPQALCCRSLRELLFALASRALFALASRALFALASRALFALASRALFVLASRAYLSATGLEAEPPRLLRTVIFSGYVGQDSEALKRPLPLFFSVPTRAPVAVT